MHEPKPIPVNERTENDNSACNDLMTTAKRELVVFKSAVTQLFGPEQARLSAEDWLDELVSVDIRPGSASRELQLITVAALARLVVRLTVTLHRPNATGRFN